MLRRSSLVIAFILSIWFLTSCSGSKKEHDEALIIALESRPATMDPRFATDANGMRITNLLFQSLVRMGPELKVIGDAAKTWNYQDLTYTFELHPGLTFSNGQRVQKSDIEFTFQEYQSTKNPFHPALKAIKEVIVSEKDGHLTVQLRLSEFSATLLTDLTPVKILPKSVVSQHGKDFHQHLVGSGSFKVAKESAGEIRLEVNPHHKILIPKMKTLVFKIIQDDNTLYLKTLKGAIDISQAVIPLNKVKNFENDAKFNVHKYSGLSMNYILINLRDPLLKNKQMRLAIAHAIDREEIIRYKLHGLATPATSILSPANPFHDKELKNPKNDFERAKALLTSIGALGKTLVLKTSNNPSVVERAKVIASQLRKIGLQVKLQSFEWGTFYKDVKDGQFQLAMMRWVGATDPDIYRVAFHTNQFPPGRNRGFYTNPEVDLWLDQGPKIIDVKERIKHYQKVQKLSSADLPTIPLWYGQQVAIVHRRVKGYKPPLNGDFTPFVFVEKAKTP